MIAGMTGVIIDATGVTTDVIGGATDVMIDATDAILDGGADEVTIVMIIEAMIIGFAAYATNIDNAHSFLPVQRF
jgi:hypothetical protein